MEFPRIQRLPPYTLGVVTQLMTEARQRGEDIINLGMGNPDLPTPPHVVDKLIEAAGKGKRVLSMSEGVGIRPGSKVRVNPPGFLLFAFACAARAETGNPSAPGLK